jgi:WD40 repeat protein
LITEIDSMGTKVVDYNNPYLIYNTYSDDISFHPYEDSFCLSNGSNALTLYDVVDGHTLDTVGGRSCLGHGDQPPGVELAYRAVTFAGSGVLIVACSLSDYRTHVLDVVKRTYLGSFFGCDTCFALHPQRNIIATVRNDQGGAAVRFVELSGAFSGSTQEVGWDPPRVKVCDAEDEFGWYPDPLNVSGMVFSPNGTSFAVVGGAASDSYEVCSYRFPSLEKQFHFHRDVSREHLVRADAMGLTAERAAFHPSSFRLLVPLPSGAIQEFDLRNGNEIGRFQEHRSWIRTLDVQHAGRTAISGDMDGGLCMWRIED